MTETPEATIARLTAERNDALKRLCEVSRQLGWWKGAAAGLIALLEECANDLEAEVLANGEGDRRTKRDLEPVVEARRMVEIVRHKLKEEENG